MSADCGVHASHARSHSADVRSRGRANVATALWAVFEHVVSTDVGTSLQRRGYISLSATDRGVNSDVRR